MKLEIQIINKIGKKKDAEKNRVINKNRQNKKEAKISDDIINDKSGMQDNLNTTTKNFLCFNDKTLTENDTNTPEENHFQAIFLMQIIKSNSNQYS